MGLLRSLTRLLYHDFSQRSQPNEERAKIAEDDYRIGLENEQRDRDAQASVTLAENVKQGRDRAKAARCYHIRFDPDQLWCRDCQKGLREIMHGGRDCYGIGPVNPCGAEAKQARLANKPSESGFGIPPI